MHIDPPPSAGRNWAAQINAALCFQKMRFSSIAKVEILKTANWSKRPKSAAIDFNDHPLHLPTSRPQPINIWSAQIKADPYFLKSAILSNRERSNLQNRKLIKIDKKWILTISRSVNRRSAVRNDEFKSTPGSIFKYCEFRQTRTSKSSGTGKFIFHQKMQIGVENLNLPANCGEIICKNKSMQFRAIQIADPAKRQKRIKRKKRKTEFLPMTGNMEGFWLFKH